MLQIHWFQLAFSVCFVIKTTNEFWSLLGLWVTQWSAIPRVSDFQINLHYLENENTIFYETFLSAIQFISMFLIFISKFISKI